MTAIVSQSVVGVNLYEAYAAIDVTATPEVPAHPFQYGAKVVATDGSEWIFGKVASTVTSIAQYHTVLIDNDYDGVVPILGGAAAQARAKRPGFYQGETTLTAGMAAWFMISGSPTIMVGEDCEPRVTLYSTDVSGVLDDLTASTSQYAVRGVFALTSVLSSGSADAAVPGIATFPTIGLLAGDAG